MTAQTSSAGTHSPGTHFHVFSKLPTELRLCIWQMAICTDDMARIHYYSLFNEENGRQSSLQSMIANRPPKLLNFHCHSSTARTNYPKLHSKPHNYSWADANRFLYYWNAGIRTACRESCEVLSDHLKAVPESRLPKPNEIIKACEKGQNVYIEVARRDIVCFRFLSDDLAAWPEFSWPDLLSRLPLFHLPQVPDMNLALEFHDSWDQSLETNNGSIWEYLKEPSHRGLALRAYWEWKMGRIPRFTRLWLIDRGNRLPQKYKLGMSMGTDGDVRYDRETHFRRRVPNEFGIPLTDQVFIDGKNKYVESYSWDNYQGFESPYAKPTDVPVMSFIWKVEHFCCPWQTMSEAARTDSQHFFRVLRLLHDTNGTG